VDEFIKDLDPGSGCLEYGIKELEDWLEKAEKLEIDEITSFVNGIRQDKDTIEPEYNNGLAERSINKLRTIKRIIYGRINFGMLRSRLLQ